jgi:hypothetical protein
MTSLSRGWIIAEYFRTPRMCPPLRRAQRRWRCAQRSSVAPGYTRAGRGDVLTAVKAGSRKAAGWKRTTTNSSPCSMPRLSLASDGRATRGCCSRSDTSSGAGGRCGQ